MIPAFGSGWAGGRSPKLVFVAEAWGADEESLGGQPLIGASGKEFWLMLGEALGGVAPEAHRAATALHQHGLAWVRRRRDWLDAAGISLTNVFNLRPQDNNLEALCGGKPSPGAVTAGMPALFRAKYLRPEFWLEVERLYEELAIAQPNLVVALGNTACWALLRSTGISALRGTIAQAQVPGLESLKILPTYHPAGVLRQWNWRPIVVADLIKSWGEAQFPEIRRPERRILVNPTLEEAQQWTTSCLISFPGTCELLACDIETQAGQITCIGFAKARDDALVIPFADRSAANGSYWPSAMEERSAWECVKELLESDIPKVFQNGVYDLQYLMKMGLRPANCAEDTMLLHHSLFPEMQKGLGFLGSIYTCEPAWKLMRRKRPDTEKRDE